MKTPLFLLKMKIASNKFIDYSKKYILQIYIPKTRLVLDYDES